MKNFFKNLFIPHEGNNHKPHFFHEAAVASIMTAALFLFVTSFGSSFIIRHTSLLGNVYSAVLVTLANETRVSNNEKPLAINPVLETAAKLKAEDMVSKGYFAHTSPEGLTPWYWFGQAGYKFNYAGENLAVGFSESQDVNEGWLNSPTHKENILNIHFTEIGIATAEGVYKGRPTTYVVQMFGSPKQSKTIPVRPVSPVTPSQNTTIVSTQPAQQASVLGSETAKQALAMEVVTKDIYTDEKLSVVQAADADTTSPVVENSSGTQIPSTQALTWYERILVNEPLAVNYIFMGLLIVIGFALFVYLVHEVRVRHWRHFFYGTFLFAAVAALFIMNKSFLFID